MNKNINKLFQNILCSIIAIAMIFGVLVSVANANATGTNATVPSVEVTNEDDIKEPMQDLIVTAVSLSKQGKSDFIKVLEDLREENATSYAEESSSYIARVKSILLAEGLYDARYDRHIEKALRSFVNYESDSKKELLIGVLSMISLPEKMYDGTDKFKGIKETINYEVTGDKANDTGFKLFIELFKKFDALSSSSGEIFSDDELDKNKLKIDVSSGSEFLTKRVDNFIASLKSMELLGIKNFDDFVTYVEKKINSHSNTEIKEFKLFLGVPQTPTPTPTKTPSSGGGGGGGGGGSKASPTPTPSATPVIVEPTPSTVPAADIENHWAKEFVLTLLGKDIVKGYPDGTIKPDANITRTEMAVVLAKTIGLNEVEVPEFDFVDGAEVPAWAAGYVKAVVDKGIMVGYEDNTFKPAKNLSREEMVVLLVKAFEFAASEDPELAFEDSEEIGGWSEAYVAKAVELGFVKGYPDNTFKPKKDVTRAEAFTVLVKCMEEKEKSSKTETSEEKE